MRVKLTDKTDQMARVAGTLYEIAESYTAVYRRLINAASTMGDAFQSAENLVFVNLIYRFCDDLKALADHLETGADAVREQLEDLWRPICELPIAHPLRK